MKKRYPRSQYARLPDHWRQPIRGMLFSTIHAIVAELFLVVVLLGRLRFQPHIQPVESLGLYAMHDVGVGVGGIWEVHWR